VQSSTTLARIDRATKTADAHTSGGVLIPRAKPTRPPATTTAAAIRCEQTSGSERPAAPSYGEPFEVTT